MKKKMTALFIALLVLFPKTSHADLDVLATAQDQIKVFQEKVTTLTTKYLGIQVNLQEVALNRNIVSSLRDQVKSQLESKAKRFIKDAKKAAIDTAMEFANQQLSAVTLPGLNNSISLGPYTSPVLKQKVAKSYTKRTNQNNDIAVNIMQDTRNNQELAENLAIIYANALVTRKNLMKENEGDGNSEESEETENEDEESDNPDVNTVQFRYGQTARRANHRWLEILKFESAYYGAVAKIQMTTGRVGDISSIIGDSEENIDTEGLEDIAADVGKSRKSVDALALWKQYEKGKEAIKKGDYAGALNAAGKAYGIGAVEGNQKVADIVSKATRGAGDAYNSAKRGNWGGAVGSVGNAVGSSIGGDAGKIINTAASGGGKAINNAASGNWSGVVTGVGNTVGTSIGGNSGLEIGAVGDLIGGGMEVGKKGGDANEVFDNILNNRTINSGLGDLGSLDTSKEDSQKQAEEEAKQKQQEEVQESLKKTEEQMKQELKEQLCTECKEAAKKEGKSETTIAIECAIRCSN